MCMKSSIQRGLTLARTLTFKSLLLLSLIILFSACSEESVSDGDGDSGDSGESGESGDSTDTTSPEITLLGANPIQIVISSGATFTDPGATATDDVDGDISANIVVGGDTVDASSPGTYVLTYDVSDAAGNAATQVTRTVVVTDDVADEVPDTTPPEITLLGANPFEIDISSGGTFTDPGATASDDVDGDISASIVIGGATVDPSTPGTYLVTYDVSDAAGNAASQVVRTVVVVDGSRLIISEDFESFTAYEPNENGFYWTTDNNTGTVSEPDNASNTVMSFEFTGNADLAGDAQAQQGFGLGSNQQELWFSYRLFVPENYHHRDAISSDNNEAFFTIWGGDYSGSNVHSRTEFWPQDDGTSVFSFAYQRHNQTDTTHYFTDSDGRTQITGIEAADYGQWMDVVVQIKVSDKGATNGAFNIWKNGALLASWRDLDNSSADGIEDNGYTDGYLLGWSNSGFTETTTFYMDDFKLGTTADSIGFCILASMMSCTSDTEQSPQSDQNLTPDSRLWAVNMDFEGAQGDVVAGPNGFTVLQSDTTYESSEVLPYAGSTAAKMLLDVSDQSAQSYGRWGGGVEFYNSTYNGQTLTNLFEGDEIFIKFQYYVPSSYDLAVDAWIKWFRISTYQADESNRGRLDFQWGDDQLRFYYEGLDPQTPTEFDFSLPRDQWFEVRVHIVLGSDEGINKWWINDTLILDETKPTLGADTDQVGQFLMHTTWNGTYPESSQSTYLDDLLITSNREEAVATGDDWDL
ncbi:MAG: immunoglobulin-like domain-containing protein [Candidatus Thiodiazotropha sp.]